MAGGEERGGIGRLFPFSSWVLRVEVTCLRICWQLNGKRHHLFDSVILNMNRDRPAYETYHLVERIK